jgi:hypothetical protein
MHCWCPVGADDLLAKNAATDVRVFVIWFKMYPGDKESRWPRDLFFDARVSQRWDEPRRVAGSLHACAV